MSQKSLVRNGKVKDNSRKSGAGAAKKERKRAEAEERNKAYQALTFEQKLERHREGGKVYNKLMAQKAKREQQAANQEKKKDDK